VLGPGSFLPAEGGKPIIEPSELTPIPWLRGDAAILVMTPRMLKLAESMFEVRPKKCGVPACLKRAVTSAEGREIPILLGYFGAPAAAMLLEILIASGVRGILFLGEAGSISRSARIGDVVLPEWAIREEGTSYHYLPPEELPRPDPDLLETFERSLRSLGVRPIRGGVWTTDAPFRETERKVEEYASRGALAVEMECSALMAVASFRKVSLAAGLAITDELFEGTWRPGFRKEGVKRARRALIEAAVRTLI